MVRFKRVPAKLRGKSISSIICNRYRDENFVENRGYTLIREIDLIPIAFRYRRYPPVLVVAFVVVLVERRNRQNDKLEKGASLPTLALFTIYFCLGGVIGTRRSLML